MKQPEILKEHTILDTKLLLCGKLRSNSTATYYLCDCTVECGMLYLILIPHLSAMRLELATGPDTGLYTSTYKDFIWFSCKILTPPETDCKQLQCEEGSVLKLK